MYRYAVIVGQSSRYPVEVARRMGKDCVVDG